MSSMQFQKKYTVRCGDDTAELHWDPMAKVWSDGGTILRRKQKRFFLDVGDGDKPCRSEGDLVVCGEMSIALGESPKSRPITRKRQRSDRKHMGVGSCLSRRITGFLRIKRPGAKCGCARLAGQMDRWGPDGCEENRATIIDSLVENVDMLAEAITAANVPGCGMLAKLIGTPAVNPILRLGAGWLLNGAIRDAKAHLEEMKSLRQRPAVRMKYDPPEPLAFEGKPKLTLISHLWPKPGWEWHLDKLVPLAGQFDRKVVGIATGPGTDTFKEAAAKLGPGWELLAYQNEPRYREVVTYPELLAIAGENRGPDDVTFCHHFKGTQEHNQGQGTIEWWSEAMYETVLGNISEVLAEMESGAWLVGSFRRFGRMLGTRHRWHFSGTYYAVRNARVFQNGVPKVRRHWWGTESWPGDYFPASHSACIFGDNVGDLYQEREQPRAALERWRADRADDA